MDHNEIRHKLSEYIDGTLSPQVKASVEEHLKICPDCSSALMELRKTVEHVRKVEEVEPPVWMTQKIMAKVRAEEEKKKQGLFHRIFFPLHIKLPLETIGVLFIAVTVYFVVQETKQPFLEAPIQTNSQESSPSVKGTGKEDKAAPEASLQRKKEVPQEPEYKALDMKPAYEKPKPPLPAPAPEPAKPAEKQRALKEEPALERKSADQNARGFMYDAPEKESSDRESASQPPTKKKAATASAEMSEKQILTLVVSDVDQAAARVEDAVKEYGGKITRKETADGVLSVTVAIDPAARNRFIDRLKTVGELKDKGAKGTYREGTVIAIKIVKQIQQN